MSWYRWHLRSAADGDTHWGRVDDQTVLAVCGARFPAFSVFIGDAPGLPGEPPYPEQKCPRCMRVKSSAAHS